MSVSSVASFYKNVRHYFLTSWGEKLLGDILNIDYEGLWNVLFTNNFQAVGFVKLFHSCSFHTNFNLLVYCFQIERIGPQHQAGSDSLLTGAAFFKMREVRSYNCSIFNDHRWTQSGRHNLKIAEYNSPKDLDSLLHCTFFNLRFWSIFWQLVINKL